MARGGNIVAGRFEPDIVGEPVTARTWPATALLVGTVIALPLLAFAFVAMLFGFTSPIVNIDLFAIYLISALLAHRSRRLAAYFALAGVVFALSVQVLLGVGVIYLDDPALIREYLSFAVYWPWRLIGLWVVIAAAVFTGYYMLLRRVPMERARKLPVLFAALTLLGLDLAGRTSGGYDLVGPNVVTSSLSRGHKLAKSWITTAGFSAAPLNEATMVSRVTAGPLPARLLSISVEALGFANDERFNARMFAPMQRELAGVYEVVMERRNYRGATLAGELRELCGQRTAGTPTRAKAALLKDGCLPAMLAAQGYESLAIHGNPQFFYNRAEVYPALGFTSTKFLEDYASSDREGLICQTRAFNGVCDRAVMRTALEFLSSKPLAYAHIMTLDTHFPLGTTALGDSRCASDATVTDGDLCLYQNQMANLLAMMAREIRSATRPPDVVYLFGDHAPPYVVAKERNFFDRKQVPFITLRRLDSGEQALR